MPNPKMNEAEQDRISRGQSVAIGDTGDGTTGVPGDEQGISNRPGDRDLAGDAEAVIERNEDSAPDDEEELDDELGDGTSDDRSSAALESEPDKV